MGLLNKAFEITTPLKTSERLLAVMNSMVENRQRQALEAFGGEDFFSQILSAVDSIDEGIEDVSEHLFTRRSAESGDAASKRFIAMTERWDAGVRPSLPAITEAWMDRLGIHEDTAYRKFLPLIAARAEMVKGQPVINANAVNDEPAYHNRVHTLQVFQSACYLIEAHQELVSNNPEISDPFLRRPLSEQDIATIMAAALAHDIDHPGRGNKDPDTGEDRPFYNEDKSVDAIKPLIEAGCNCLSLTSEIVPILRQAVRYTDPGRPRSDMIEIIEALRNGQRPLGKSYAEYADVRSMTVAAIVSDADLLFSGGMGEKALQENSKKLTAESKSAGLNMDFNNAASNKFFFDNILGDTYLSGSARSVFNPVYHELRSNIEQRLEAH